MGIFEEIMASMNSILSPFAEAPASSILILIVAALVSLITSAVNRLLVDVERLRQVSKEVAEWRREFLKARKTGDKNLMARVMKREQAIRQMQLKMSADQFKVTIITLFPLMALFFLLSGFFGNRTVAYSPFPIPFVGEGLLFFHWYIISSFAVNLPLSRILGLRPED